MRILNLVPKAYGPNSANGQVGLNYQIPFLSQTRSKIPSVKGDQSIGSKHHVSFYGGGTLMDAPYTATNGNAEGFPSPITGARASFIYTKTYRLNWDYRFSPTLLLHFGAGWFQQEFNDDSPATTSYDAAAAQTCTSTPSFDGLLDQTCTGGLGLTGARINRQFPRFIVTNAGFNGAATTATGGMNSVGPFTQGPSKERRPSGVANATWVHGNHTYKLGGEWRQERYPATSYTGTTGQYTFASNSTMQTALDGVQGTSNGVFGFGFASFLRGDVDQFLHRAARQRDWSKEADGAVRSGHLEGYAQAHPGLRPALGLRNLRTRGERAQSQLQRDDRQPFRWRSSGRSDF